MALREILRYIGASEADMEKGQLRAEANVSVRRTGAAEFGVKTELKNINSFRALHRAGAYEIERQVQVREAGGAVVQETLGWSEPRQETFSQRSKEFAQDYRYFPEPDLPPLELDPAWIERLRAELPELPAARRARLLASPHAGGYGLTEYMARRLVTDREIADYYELVMAETGEPVDTSFNQAVANWLLEDFVPTWQQQNPGQPSRALSPSQMANLFGLLHSRRVSHEKARELMKLVWGTPKVPEEVARERGFEAIDNPESLAFFADLAIDSKRQAARDFLSGKQEAFGALMQELRTQSEGKADMRAAGQVLRDRLATRRDELL